MTRNFHKAFKSFAMALCLAGTALSFGQEKQTKTYKESFTVKPDAVVDINVSYADIAFETWNKNEVVVEATIEIEGVEPEEAIKIFEKGGIEILGNSSLVEIRSMGSGPVLPMPPHEPFVIDIPEIPNMEPLFLDLQIPDLPPLPDLPPVPPVPVPEFDYKAYQKDGEKYLKSWKQEFEKNFDMDYRKKMEAWGEEMAAGSEERRKHIEAWQKEHEQMQQEREEQQEEMKRHREEMRERAEEHREIVREHARASREQAREIHRNITITRQGEKDAPYIFYRSADGEGKKLKIKKTIKIKMPKSVKLKMNVRHGEVKLAENTRDLHATLSYARLLASTIDGQKTHITASYTPVNVLKWNYGSLRTDFADEVALSQVKNLDLTANSSNVTIDLLLNSARIENNLGQVRINSVADTFERMDFVMQNGELFIDTPDSAYNLQFDGTSSRFTPPAYLQLKKTGDQKQIVYKGFHLNENSNRNILIHSRYSDVTLHQ